MDNSARAEAANYIYENAIELLTLAQNNKFETVAHCLELAGMAAAEAAAKLQMASIPTQAKLMVVPRR